MENGIVYMGRVISREDERYEGRIKVEIANVTEGLTLDEQQWCYPKFQSHRGSFNTPEIDDIVQIEFNNGNKYDPRYTLFNTIPENLKEILKESYENSRVIFYDELLNTCLYYTVERGLYFENDGSIIQLRKDKSISITENEGKTIHLNSNKISLGKEGESDESAVLGEKNEETLETLTEGLEEIVKVTKTEMEKISIACNTLHWTQHLAPPIKAYGTVLETSLNSIISKIKQLIPETKSKSVTLDK